MELLLILILLGFGSVICAFSYKLPEVTKSWLLPLPAVVSFLFLISAGNRYIQEGETVDYAISWVPSLDLDFSLNLTGIGLLMGLLILGIGSCIMLYASGYMKGYSIANRLFLFLYAFMFAMVGLVFSNHFITLFVFWELTSITSYLLIGFNHDKEGSRQNALQALVVTGLGGMALLAGLILLNMITGTWLISELAPFRSEIIRNDLYPAILSLIVLGTFTKSAQFPFHFWLPNAMAAPTPVSAFLHSATMVKAGVYLLIVLLPVLGGTIAWTITLTLSGGLTLILAGLNGLKETDLKRVLASTTLAVLGLLTFMIGLGTEKALWGAVIFLFAHALYKATLFMVAGSIDHETGTREIRLLGGLRRLMPWTAAAAGLAALSKMGIPGFFGFLGKEYVYKGALASVYSLAAPAVLVLGNALLFVLAFKVGIAPFSGKRKEELPKTPHEAPWSMRIGPILLAGLGLLFGLFPSLLAPLMTVASGGDPSSITSIKLWQGFNMPLLLSAVTVTLGILLTGIKDPLSRILSALKFFGKSGERAYNYIFKSIIKIAAYSTQKLQSGYLRNYLWIIISTTSVLVSIKLWRFGSGNISMDFSVVSLGVGAISILMVAGIILAVRATARLTALVALGIIGFSIAFLFASYSAPDLAITQILVETLTVVFFSWVVFRLPEFNDYSTQSTKVADATLSAIIGVLVSILVLKSKVVELAPSISETLSDWSQPLAHGANVVNVILVDFRALDTWGEIIVLGIAAMGVWALLVSMKGEKEGE